ncbi:GNAT family N-acetyltransferase [Streptomyces sp. NPDC006335]|uniref:GNAT family N-acetyltransferase n=1 Tax=Streptomyces sp. NPDC006335 TaxID=3156895 RepID=UPI0033A80283
MLNLYGSVGLEGYTSDVDKLCRGLVNSHLVITARDGSGTLLGLARTISDDEHICYVQDVVVNPANHRQGVGRALCSASRHWPPSWKAAARNERRPIRL